MMKALRLRLHPEVADAFQNQRRGEIVSIEEEFDLRIEIVATPGMAPIEEDFEWSARSVQERAEARAINEAAVESVEMARRPSRRRRGSRGRRQGSSQAVKTES